MAQGHHTLNKKYNNASPITNDIILKDSVEIIKLINYKNGIQGRLIHQI